MKKSIFTFVLATSLIGGAVFTGCQSSAKKVEEAQENVADANEKLAEAKRDSILLFKMESEKRFSNQEKNLAEFKMRIAKEKKENRAKYEKNLAELEKKNSDLKKKLDDFKDDGNVEWEIFKSEWNHDMDELGKSIKDLTVNNVK